MSTLNEVQVYQMFSDAIHRCKTPAEISTQNNRFLEHKGIPDSAKGALERQAEEKLHELMDKSGDNMKPADLTVFESYAVLIDNAPDISRIGEIADRLLDWSLVDTSEFEKLQELMNKRIEFLAGDSKEDDLDAEDYRQVEFDEMVEFLSILGRHGNCDISLIAGFGCTKRYFLIQDDADLGVLGVISCTSEGYYYTPEDDKTTEPHEPSFTTLRGVIMAALSRETHPAIDEEQLPF
jgi:hypothetical protein